MSSDDASFVMSELESHKRGTFARLMRIERALNQMDVQIKKLDYDQKQQEIKINRIIEKYNIRTPRSTYELDK